MSHLITKIEEEKVFVAAKVESLMSYLDSRVGKSDKMENLYSGDNPLKQKLEEYKKILANYNLLLTSLKKIEDRAKSGDKDIYDDILHEMLNASEEILKFQKIGTDELSNEIEEIYQNELAWRLHEKKHGLGHEKTLSKCPDKQMVGKRFSDFFTSSRMDGNGLLKTIRINGDELWNAYLIDKKTIGEDWQGALRYQDLDNNINFNWLYDHSFDNQLTKFWQEWNAADSPAAKYKIFNKGTIVKSPNNEPVDWDSQQVCYYTAIQFPPINQWNQNDRKQKIINFVMMPVDQAEGDQIRFESLPENDGQQVYAFQRRIYQKQEMARLVYQGFSGYAIDKKSFNTDNEKEQEIAKRKAFANVSAELRNRVERLRTYAEVNNIDRFEMRTYDARTIYNNHLGYTTARTIYTDLSDIIPPSLIYSSNLVPDVAPNQEKIAQINAELNQALVIANKK